MRPDIVPGTVFHDYELPHQRGKRCTLSELQEQQEAWAKGDKTSFYPYGKTQAQVLAA